ncbi:hypothetical protein [Cupriavidus sp. CuC1]|uniref:hypothetical protein n=1 Tax=Cupriavidus sp. CuC1 TaxID=3373131 RepID=UPI0037D12478
MDDIAPGSTRRRFGGGVAYLDANGKPVRDVATLARIAALAIPPAYKAVWICADPAGPPDATRGAASSMSIIPTGVRCGIPTSARAWRPSASRKKQVAEVIRAVAQRLRNTVALCRKCYVHPDVIEAFMNDELRGCARIAAISRLRADEARLLKPLSRRAAAQIAQRPRYRTARRTPKGRLPT